MEVSVVKYPGVVTKSPIGLFYSTLLVKQLLYLWPACLPGPYLIG